jgi:hypothetical protein
MITPDERAVLLGHCSDHVVAVCPGCATPIPMSRLGADLISGRRDLCPSCGASVTDSVRQHLAECPSVPRDPEAAPGGPHHEEEAGGGGEDASHAT